MKNVSLYRINKLPPISGGEVTSEKIKELTQNEFDLLIMQIKRSNTANDLHFILEGKNNQVCITMHKCAYCRIHLSLNHSPCMDLVLRLHGHFQSYSKTGLVIPV